MLPALCQGGEERTRRSGLRRQPCACELTSPRQAAVRSAIASSGYDHHSRLCVTGVGPDDGQAAPIQTHATAVRPSARDGRPDRCDEPMGVRTSGALRREEAEGSQGAAIASARDTAVRRRAPRRHRTRRAEYLPDYLALALSGWLGRATPQGSYFSLELGNALERGLVGLLVDLRLLLLGILVAAPMVPAASAHLRLRRTGNEHDSLPRPRARSALPSSPAIARDECIACGRHSNPLFAVRLSSC